MSASSQDRPLLGILLMLAFCAIIPFSDALAKLLGERFPLLQLIQMRFLAQTVLFLPVALILGHALFPSKRAFWLTTARTLLQITGLGCMFSALRFLPLADAVAIAFVMPFIMLLLGRFFLDEEVGPRRLIACAVGFTGALFIIQPSFANVGTAALFPLVTAVTFATYLVLTRNMAVRMHPITMQVYTGFAALALAVPILWAFNGSGFHPLDPVWPQGDVLLLLLGLGVVATISHVMISFSLSMAPASLVAPVQYLEIVSATALGFYIFGDLPGPYTYVGVALIVGAGLYVVAGETQPKPRRKAKG